MGIRRSMAAGALVVLFVAGGAGAAAAADGARGSGAPSCDRVAAKTADIQRELARLEHKLSATGGPRERRLARLQQRKDRAEQKLQSLQAACQS